MKPPTSWMTAIVVVSLAGASLGGTQRETAVAFTVSFFLIFTVLLVAVTAYLN